MPILSIQQGQLLPALVYLKPLIIKLVKMYNPFYIFQHNI